MSTATLGLDTPDELPTSAAPEGVKLDGMSIRNLYAEAKLSVESGRQTLKTAFEIAPDLSRPKPVSTATYVGGKMARTKADTVSRPLAEWQGYITSVEDGTIYAKLEGIYGYDVKGKTFDTSIPIAEVADDDLGLVKPGAYFRMSVAYEVTHSGFGTSSRQSRVVFRRLPVFRESEIAESRQLAEELLNGIRLE